MTTKYADEREERLLLIEYVVNAEEVETEEDKATARAMFDRLFPEPELDLKSFLSTAWLQAIRKHRAENKSDFKTANDAVQKLFASFNSHNKSDR